MDTTAAIPTAPTCNPASFSPWLCRFMYLAPPLLVLGAIWFTVIKYYHVSSPIITKHMMEQSRQVPSDDLLDELSQLRFFDNENRLYTVDVAERILKGELALPGEAPRRIHLPFDPMEINDGSSDWQLFHARLLIPRILLNAYRITQREEFFLMAREVLLRWAAYERHAVLPKGYLWGDHAISERVYALVDFWSVYRHHPSYDEEVAEALFVFAGRCGHFLSDPEFFLLLSNHGVMQNLALWHLSLAFPTLPETPRYSQLAFERLGELMHFYINEEGFVLEHSAGYQKTGVQFMSMALRYMTLLEIDIPLGWRQRFEKALKVYAKLRRPDGSWPMFGDTEGGVDLLGPLVPKFEEEGRYGPLKQRAESSRLHEESLYPIAGYSIWWDRLNDASKSEDLAQTVIAWSYFPGHAHKHADEMSIILWAAGLTWWSNVGYWPYGTEERSEAESWNGSNAPHLTGESAASNRKTKMLRHARTDDLSFIDLERRGPQAYVGRRQVVHAMNNLWVVLDHTSGNINDRTTTVWTTSHDMEMTEGWVPGAYRLTHPMSKAVLNTFLFGSGATTIRRYRGSHEPFAGWQMAEDIPKPASALMVEQPANDSWMVAVWSLDAAFPGKRIIAMPAMTSWKGPENWMISFLMESGTVQVSREGDNVFLDNGRTTPLAHLTLARPADTDEKIREIEVAKERTRKDYPFPRFRDALDYRWKATYLVIFVLFLQELFFAVYRRFTCSRYLLLRGLTEVAWVVMGIWLVVRVPLI